MTEYSLDDMIKYVHVGDLENLKKAMMADSTYLTDKICTKLLVVSLERNKVPIANYILKYEFDIDPDIFEEYLDSNRPFTSSQIKNLNLILNRFYICCLANN
jgi:hypothetical protein